MYSTHTAESKLSVFVFVDVRLFAFLNILSGRRGRSRFFAVVGRFSFRVTHDENSMIVSRIAQIPRSQAAIVSSP